MKNADKVTLTFGQLKKLILESEDYSDDYDEADDFGDSIETEEMLERMNSWTTKDGEKCKIGEKDGKHFIYIDNKPCHIKQYPMPICIELGSGEFKNLSGSPDKFTGAFECGYKPNVSSLVGAPRIVYGSFHCYNQNLTTLEGAPEEVYGDFFCSENSQLTSLKGAPKKVTGTFNTANCGNLVSLEGVPAEVEEFFCDNCKNLSSLKGAPGTVNGRVDLSNLPKVSWKEFNEYKKFLAMSPEEKAASGKLDSTGHYDPNGQSKEELDRRPKSDGPYELTIVYPDYEDADIEIVDWMISQLKKIGGNILNWTADERDDEAVIHVRMPASVEYDRLVKAVQRRGFVIR